MNAPVAALRDALRSQLWPIPVLGVIVAVAAGIALPVLDAAADASLPAWLTSLIFSGDAGAARTVLDAIASSLITVTSLTFSLTVVTLQLASSQFSPRLLRTFTSDVFVQVTLGIFLATFTYALTVLRSVRGSDAALTEFVPRLSVTASFVLTLASVVMLVVFLAHLAQQIRIETLLRDVHEDASATLRATLTEPRAAGSDPAMAPHPDVPPVPAGACRILAPSSGFLVRVDADDLLERCRKHGLVVVIDRHTGTSVVEGTPIGWAWRLGRSGDLDLAGEVQGIMRATVHTGVERTAVQDIGYGLRQLTDVANKALSPGINDPTTAVHTLGHISALLCEVSAYDLGPVVLTDDDDVVRVVLHRPDLADLVEAALAQPRRYGASDPQVMQRLFQLLAELGWCCRPVQRPVILGQLERLVTTAHAQDFDAVELERLDQAAAEVRQAVVELPPEAYRRTDE